MLWSFLSCTPGEHRQCVLGGILAKEPCCTYHSGEQTGRQWWWGGGGQAKETVSWLTEAINTHVGIAIITFNCVDQCNLSRLIALHYIIIKCFVQVHSCTRLVNYVITQELTIVITIFSGWCSGLRDGPPLLPCPHFELMIKVIATAFVNLHNHLTIYFPSLSRHHGEWVGQSEHSYAELNHQY